MIPAGITEDEGREHQATSSTTERAAGQRKPAEVIDLTGKLDISKHVNRNCTCIQHARQGDRRARSRSSDDA